MTREMHFRVIPCNPHPPLSTAPEPEMVKIHNGRKAPERYLFSRLPEPPGGAVGGGAGRGLRGNGWGP